MGTRVLCRLAAMKNLPVIFAPVSSPTGRFQFGATVRREHPLTAGETTGDCGGASRSERQFSVTTIVTTDRANEVRELLEGGQ